MADLINLNKARKDRTRAEAKADAAGNRVRFGRTRAEKTLSWMAAERAGRALDAKKRDA